MGRGNLTEKLGHGWSAIIVCGQGLNFPDVLQGRQDGVVVVEGLGDVTVFGWRPDPDCWHWARARRGLIPGYEKGGALGFENFALQYLRY